jgi:exodeoxyribonuclease VII large subunit
MMWPGLEPIRSSDLAASENVLSVSGLNAQIKALLEPHFSQCWVQGEVSNLKVQPSGHAYFTLKDAQSQIPAVLFRGWALYQDQLKDGAQIIALGGVHLYEPRGQYQLLVRFLLPAGQGQLRLELERRKARLAQMGYFDEQRKRPIPTAPKVVALVTSPTGAVLHDFLKVLERRCWRGKVIVVPTKVQGKEAPLQLIAAVRRAAQLPQVAVVVLARGGGSLEDLWCFNDEALVKALFDLPVPVISAIGHETDYTLCDAVADKRAETPTAAAEAIAQHRVALIERCQRARAHMTLVLRQWQQQLLERQALWQARLARFRPRGYLESVYLRLEHARYRLGQAKAHNLLGPRARVLQARQRLGRLCPQAHLDALRQALQHLARRLHQADPRCLLSRGFALIQDPAGQCVTTWAQCQSQPWVRMTFADASGAVHLQPFDPPSS